MATIISRNRTTRSHTTLVAGGATSFVRLSDDRKSLSIRVEGEHARNYHLHFTRREFDKVVQAYQAAWIQDYQEACSRAAKDPEGETS